MTDQTQDKDQAREAERRSRDRRHTDRREVMRQRRDRLMDCVQEASLVVQTTHMVERLCLDVLQLQPYRDPEGWRAASESPDHLEQLQRLAELRTDIHRRAENLDLHIRILLQDLNDHHVSQTDR